MRRETSTLRRSGSGDHVFLIYPTNLSPHESRIPSRSVRLTGGSVTSPRTSATSLSVAQLAIRWARHIAMARTCHPWRSSRSGIVVFVRPHLAIATYSHRSKFASSPSDHRDAGVVIMFSVFGFAGWSGYGEISRALSAVARATWRTNNIAILSAPHPSEREVRKLAKK